MNTDQIAEEVAEDILKLVVPKIRKEQAYPLPETISIIQTAIEKAVKNAIVERDQERPTPATARGSEQSIIALTVRKRLELLAKDAPDEWAGILMDEAKAIEQVIQQWPTPATVSEPLTPEERASINEFAMTQGKPDSDSGEPTISREKLDARLDELLKKGIQWTNH